MKKINKKLNILFVCKYNRFRSRVAEAYFKKINKNKRIRVKSAGLIIGNPLGRLSINTAKDFGLNINGKSQGLSTKLLKWQDIIVIVADDVPKKIFYNRYRKKLIVWKIKDIKDNDKTKIGRIRVIKKIMKKVGKLNKMLKRGKVKW